MKRQAGRLTAIWGIPTALLLAAPLLSSAAASAAPVTATAPAQLAAAPNVSAVIPATVTHQACDGDFGTIFNPMTLCLYFTINGSGVHVNYFRAKVCIDPTLTPVNFFHGHVEFKGRSGHWNTSHMTVGEGQCETRTVHINRNLKPGPYTAKAWQNNGGGNFRDLVNVTDHVT